MSMGGHDQSREKMKFKKFKKGKSSPKSLPNDKNNDTSLVHLFALLILIYYVSLCLFLGVSCFNLQMSETCTVHVVSVLCQ